MQHPTASDKLLRDSSETEDSDFRITTSARKPSFGLVDTDGLIPEQPQTAFTHIQPPATGSSTVKVPTNVYYGSDSWRTLNHSPSLYKTPRPVDDNLIMLFLSYHRQNISYGRYFWFWDHHRFIREGLLELAEQSTSLQYAIGAFSALIYSIQVDHNMKQFTFLFYAKAIKELQHAINTDLMNSEAAVYKTVATILELASVEVHPFINKI